MTSPRVTDLQLPVRDAPTITLVAGGRQERLAQAIDEFYAAIDAGQPVDREGLLEKYSDVADELDNCLRNLDFIQNIAPQLSTDASVSSGLGPAGFALKLNTDGKFNWVSPFVVNQSGGFSDADTIAVDSSDNVIVGGAYFGSVDFKPGSGTVTLPTAGRGLITKLNSSGGFVWARALESDSTILMYGLAVDAAGAIYASGAFHGTADFDPGTGTHTRTTAGAGDVFVVKLTAAGNFSWAETFGASGDDGAFAVSVDTTGAVHVAGWFKGTVDFDPDPLATHLLTGSDTFKNGFLLRLLQA